MTTCSPFKYFKTSPEIIRLAVMYYIRYPLSFRQMEDIALEAGRADSQFIRARFWEYEIWRLELREPLCHV